MPMGMQTMISEGQGGISGGQKQRLLIARALAPEPKVLMFDEATSALDNLTQKKVTEALGSYKSTRLVIAHRLSTIQSCDRILLLKNGNIAEDGTYDELIAKGGAFADLVERQRLDTGDSAKKESGTEETQGETQEIEGETQETESEAREIEGEAPESSEVLSETPQDGAEDGAVG